MLPSFSLLAVASALSTDAIRTKCVPLLPPTSSSSTCTIDVERLRVGNSNVLHSLTRTAPDGSAVDKFLVRQFGKSSALSLDRAAENRVFAKLSELGIAPPLVATFDGGRIEGWLEGGPCTADECRQPVVYQPVARALASLHSTPLASIDPAASPISLWGWTTAATWLDGARACAGELRRLAIDDEDLTARVASIDLDAIADQLDVLRAHLQDHNPSLVRVCYCHNDLSNTNVHRDLPSGATRLIDFEFGGVNLRGFDLATHLSHWAGGAVDGCYDAERYPSAEEVERFLQSYAAAAVEGSGAGGTGASVEQLQAEVTAAAPLAHCVWGLWALCALPAALEGGGGGRFSHIE